MNISKLRICSVREYPAYATRAIDYFSEKWGIDRRVYDDCITHSLTSQSPLPQWYLLVDESDEIVGCFGLIANDFISRQDLWPWLCGLYLDEKVRGQALGSRLLAHGRSEAGRLGFEKVYLCTDHVGYYEKYGWQAIGTGYHPWGESSTIFEADSLGEVVLEPMEDFFAARVEEYDIHMLERVEGCGEGYRKMGEVVESELESRHAKDGTLLDLGCGTGLELAEIFARMPALQVTGIDLTAVMLEKLRKKYEQHAVKTICGSYFEVELGKEAYDCAVSFQTMHHFLPDKKEALYRRILEALVPGGTYVECDYMVQNQWEEDLYFAESARLRQEQGIAEEVFCHYDTPCTVEHQINLLKQAGFQTVELVFRQENTHMLLARK